MRPNPEFVGPNANQNPTNGDKACPEPKVQDLEVEEPIPHEVLSWKQVPHPEAVKKAFTQLGLKEVPQPHTLEVRPIGDEDMEALRQGSIGLRDRLQTPNTQYKQFTDEEIRNWMVVTGSLNTERQPNPGRSALVGQQMPDSAYQPTIDFATLPLNEHRCPLLDKRFGIYLGSITNLRATEGTKASVITSNDGDLRGCCGYALAKVIHLSVGPSMQRALYNCLGTYGSMKCSVYGLQEYAPKMGEGRGFALTAYAGNMETVGGIGTVEFLTVPWGEPGQSAAAQDPKWYQGAVQMYYEALAHCANRDYIALAIAGGTHPILSEEGKRTYPNYALNARILMQAVAAFVHNFPQSKLKIIMTLFGKDQQAETVYQQAFQELEVPEGGSGKRPSLVPPLAPDLVPVPLSPPRASSQDFGLRYTKLYNQAIKEKGVQKLAQYRRDLCLIAAEAMSQELNSWQKLIRETPCAYDAIMSRFLGTTVSPAFQAEQTAAVLAVLQDKAVAQQFFLSCLKTCSQQCPPDIATCRRVVQHGVLFLRNHFVPPVYFDIPGCAGKLYYSGQVSAANRTFLEEAHIHTVCNLAGVTSDVPGANFFEGQQVVAYKTYENLDYGLKLDFDRFFSEVYNLLQEGKNVLIHCYEGRNRSATALCCVLLRSGFIPCSENAQQDVQDAITAAGEQGKSIKTGKTQRRLAAPYPPNVGSLQEWWARASLSPSPTPGIITMQALMRRLSSQPPPADLLDEKSFGNLLQAYCDRFENKALGEGDVGFIEKNDLQTGSSLFIRADLHGDWQTLVDHLLDLKSQGCLDEDFHFRQDVHMYLLGDFVNRGPSSLHVLHLIMLLKMENPDNLHLIRGNHESVALNTILGSDTLLQTMATTQAALLERFYRTMALSIFVSVPPTVGQPREYVQMTHGGCNLATDLQPLLSAQAPLARINIPKQRMLSERVRRIAEDAQDPLYAPACCVKEATERYQSFLDKLAPNHQYIARFREDWASEYTWADISDQPQYEAMTNHLYSLTPSLIASFYQVNSQAAYRIEGMLRGHQHLGMPHQHPWDQDRALIHTLPVGVYSGYVKPKFTPEQVANHVDYALLIETAPSVVGWKKTGWFHKQRSVRTQSDKTPLFVNQALVPSIT